MVIFRWGMGPNNIPPVCINDKPVIIVESFKYIGHILINADTERQRRALLVKGDVIIRKFTKAALEEYTVSVFMSNILYLSALD